MAPAFAGLAAGMASLNETQRERLLDAAIHIRDAEMRSSALANTGVWMVHMTIPQRARLLNVGAEIRNWLWKSRLIGELGSALAAIHQPKHA